MINFFFTGGNRGIIFFGLRWNFKFLIYIVLFWKITRIQFRTLLNGLRLLKSIPPEIFLKTVELFSKHDTGSNIILIESSVSKSVATVSEGVRDLFILLVSVITNIHSRRNQPTLFLIMANAVYLIRETSVITLRNLLKDDSAHSLNNL